MSNDTNLDHSKQAKRVTIKKDHKAEISNEIYGITVLYVKGN